jgi:hypothetical protein
VADLKPPRLAGDDRTTLRAFLQYQRDSFVRKLTGVDEEQAAVSSVESGTSLLWLSNHMADAEAVWILHRFAQHPEYEFPKAPAPLWQRQSFGIG